MLYRKIQMPMSENEQKSYVAAVPVNTASSSVRIIEKKLPQAVPEKDKSSQKPHGPEIVAPVIKCQVKTRKIPSGALPVGRMLAVIALCAVCFAVGCSVTNERVSETIIGISAVAFGKNRYETATDTEFKNPSAKQVTHYERYMPEDTDMKLEYLSAKMPASDMTYKEVTAEDLPRAEEIAAGGMETGSVGVDGELLYKVYSEDMSAEDVSLLLNQTKYVPDTYSLLERTPKAFENLAVNLSEPLVLVVHTHGTECYNMCEKDGYISENSLSRSENTKENVVGIGQRLTEVLESFGIPVIHSEKMCDKESFVHAYSTSADEVKRYLEMYPSIRFVIDLHRDAIENGDGSQKKPVFEFASEKTAQLMLVVGTNQAGAAHSDWEENLSLALNVQKEIQKDFPGLFRKINLRTASFNQQLSSGYMLLECGAYGNSYEEAERAVELFATGFARMISNYAE